MPRRQVEIFSAGCPICEQTIHLLRKVADEFCDITVLNVRDDTVATRARALGLCSFPAVVVEGELVSFDLFAALSRTFEESEWIRGLFEGL
jgi:glutaredoxin 3